MPRSLPGALAHNFLGQSPLWYKAVIGLFLVLNPLLLLTAGPVTAGWVLVIEFIFTLGMALKCYPLMPGGLLLVEALLLEMTTPQALYEELLHNFPVILLLMFMVAGIHFMKELLLFLFSRILLGVRSKAALSLLFCVLSAFLSAFLDALTVTAVIISAAVGFYAVFHRVASGANPREESALDSDQHIPQLHREDLDQFRAFLRSLLMHGAVGTALGGVCTLVGEPQNLLIGHEMGWHFADFFLKVAPVSLPVLGAGLLTCVALEKLRLFGYGTLMPERVRQVLAAYAAEDDAARTPAQRAALWVQGSAALILIICLGLHIAEVGLIGLLVIVLITAFTGITDEHRLGRAFQDAMPFTALLVVFFAVVAVIHQQQLFSPLIAWVLALPAEQQPGMLYLANGLLSAISDNVFVATIYITEVKQAFMNGGMSREHFETLAVAINTGTNLPSVATPNGQAAFLFLLTSAIAPLIRLSYGRMVWMALPYTVVMGGLGWWAVTYWL
ncbi:MULTISPECIES: sodium/proton antiporter NhaB [unclassified Pseudomonas]|jgi:NhaB family Na+:H+ antiporter|uniref:sodium/proton antiporter NhaB n=1 Tax=unclassified Pseudomonas TaxID=196821 RepID=UPI000422D318|nr:MULTISPECIES: sodium/proton antiporter NhaB [unclassified Pseudomonas]ATP49495.1 sodium/proton antiporter NhaB [Pseudomonas putida]MCX2684926.1 sodium/proton antiporter NhaB [Pseudomonas sp. DCB_AW]MDE4537743.1 sodium/proton antiporter NhaB [Pseudomonas sp. ITEM 17296]SMF22923.1 sodium/proton antiporter, NhaB family [Pseudomonas sp. LAIL14HWK12:I11]SMR74346.1 sodium/proton antiporter, NhaB family [Pseudomonas sp. LAIL14HWK12:I10]